MKNIKNLVIVDDDEIYVYLTKKTIEESAIIDNVIDFENGLEALNFLKENVSQNYFLPEIIFLDLSMPIMNGWQFLEEFKLLNETITKKIVIYICSSSISPQDIERAKTYSEVSNYLIKPITKSQLLDIFENAA